MSVSMPWGLTVFEDSAELDEYVKVALLSMMTWHLYTDAVRRRREELNSGGSKNWMQIFFEEANKVLGGVDSAKGSDDIGGADTSTQFRNVWRDGRKCGCTHPTHLAAPLERLLQPQAAIQQHFVLSLF
jgi:hypothetical protein